MHLIQMALRNIKKYKTSYVLISLALLVATSFFSATALLYEDTMHQNKYEFHQTPGTWYTHICFDEEETFLFENSVSENSAFFSVDKQIYLGFTIGTLDEKVYDMCALNMR